MTRGGEQGLPGEGGETDRGDVVFERPAAGGGDESLDEGRLVLGEQVADAYAVITPGENREALHFPIRFEGEQERVGPRPETPAPVQIPGVANSHDFEGVLLPGE